jgi:hypothetical protein
VVDARRRELPAREVLIWMGASRHRAAASSRWGEGSGASRRVRSPACADRRQRPSQTGRASSDGLRG